jgi:Arc/MetJ-type ribon-helix-helix transcriptional regulator
MVETTLTLRFKGLEAELLNEMVRLGLFSSKSEAIRAAVVKYAVDTGLLSRSELWRRVEKHPKRSVSPEKLAEDLESVEA